MWKLVMVFFLSSLSTLYSQTHPGLNSPLLEKNTAIDTCSEKYAAAGIKMVVDSSFSSNRNDLERVITKKFDSSGGIVSVSEYLPYPKKTYHTLY
ncbi:MAG: hypothetical protein ACRC3B_21780, partial [Bacteroidia bacterium]